MKKFRLVSAALLVLASTVPAAADDTKKPSMTTAASQQAQIMMKTPFDVWPDGNWIFVVNKGTADWTAALDVYATCTPVAPTTSCGPNFAGGKYRAGHYDKGAFPKGYGNAPIKGSANAQQVSGPGWVAVLMGLPYGSYKITATAANNSSPVTNVTIAAPPSGNVVKVSPGTIQLAPTKTP